MSLTEFEIIQDFFNKQAGEHADVVLGIGDDAAILDIPGNTQLLISTDTLVAGVHFPGHIAPADLGYRALAVNLSDMAAMGATPRWSTLAITLPEANAEWLTGFSEGFFSLANEHHVILIGGDITRGPLTITVQIHGLVKQGQAVRRHGARAGDKVFVTGELGAAGLALASMEQRLVLPASALEQVMQRYLHPVPRVTAGQALAGLATSMIDVSDGLLADLGHIVRASGCGAVLHATQIPLPDATLDLDWHTAVEYALVSGDDYELCFTVSPGDTEAMQERLAPVCPVTCIGEIVESGDVLCLDADGNAMEMGQSGYLHFNDCPE